MRVLHIHKVRGLGGSERHLLTLLPNLREAGVGVEMLVLSAPGAAPFLEALAERGIPTRVIPAGRDLSPSLLVALGRELRSSEPDLVHTHLIHADLYGQLAARLARVPGVSSLHSTHGFFLRHPYRLPSALASRSAQRVIAISEHVRDYFSGAGLVDRDRIDVVHYGIDANGWRSDDAARARARRRFGLAEGAVAVGIASRLIPIKGHAVLVESFERACREHPQLELLIAGEGELRAQLERATAEHPSIRMLGFVDDMVSFMQACDIAVFPSQPNGEGFGLAALEAMAAGNAVIASDLDSLPEVIGESGVAGLLVRHDDVGGLASLLGELADRPQWREQLGARAVERARDRFSIERMVEGTVGVYRSALAGARSAPVPS